MLYFPELGITGGVRAGLGTGVPGGAGVVPGAIPGAGVGQHLAAAKAAKYGIMNKQPNITNTVQFLIIAILFSHFLYSIKLSIRFCLYK